MSNSLVYYVNSEEYFESMDHDIFEDIVCDSIVNLENLIKKMSDREKSLIYSNSKFINNKQLNLKGLHLYRTLLANRVYNKRKQTIKNLDFFKKGYIAIEDFLDKQELEKIRTIFYKKIKPKHPNGIIRQVDGRAFLQRNERLNQLILDCSRITNFSFGYPRIELWHLVHFKNDPQSKFHSDTFQPTCKFWIYLENVEEKNGPLNFVPRSHQISKKRSKWDYENSIMSEGDDLWKRRIQNGGKPGSFRVYENSTQQQEHDAIRNMEYDIKELVGKKNTLIAANTFGFHKRGIAIPKSERATLAIEYRPQAFHIY